MSIVVVLDTSVLPRSMANPGQEYGALGELASSQVVRVVIPELAVKERVSQLRSDVEKLAGQLAESARTPVGRDKELFARAVELGEKMKHQAQGLADDCFYS